MASSSASSYSSNTVDLQNDDDAGSMVLLFNGKQQTILTILPMFTGCLSVASSGMILYLIVTRKAATTMMKTRANSSRNSINRSRRKSKYSSINENNNSVINDNVLSESREGLNMNNSNDGTTTQEQLPPLTAYERILIGMNLSSTMISIRSIGSTFLMPSLQTSSWKWGLGNDTSCSVQGFITQLGFSTTLYWASLSLYFAISIHTKCIRPDQITAVYETLFHIIPIGFAIVTSVTASVLDWYNPITPYGLGCWLGDSAPKLKWYLGGLPIILSFMIVIICMSTIYLSVRNQIRKMKVRYSSSWKNNSFNNGENPPPSSPIVDRLTKAQMKRLQKISIQACLYVSLFTISYIGPFLQQTIDSLSNPTSTGSFVVALLTQLFYPLQGFFMLFIYIRPTYNAIRQRKQTNNLSHFDTMREILGRRSSAMNGDPNGSFDAFFNNNKNNNDSRNNSIVRRLSNLECYNNGNNNNTTTVDNVHSKNDDEGCGDGHIDVDDSSFESQLRRMNLIEEPLDGSLLAASSGTIVFVQCDDSNNMDNAEKNDLYDDHTNLKAYCQYD